MSHTYFSKLWLNAQKDLTKLLELDKVVQYGKPITRKQDAIEKTVELYYRYRRMIQRLTVCHDQIVQPQIRELVGKMLDYSIVRMLEYRKEVVNLILTECPWPNDILVKMKLTPDDVDLSAPVYNAAARKAEFERRRKFVEDSLANANEKKRVIKNDPANTEVTVRESVITLGSKSALARRKRAKSEAVSVIEVELKETPEEKAARLAQEAERKAFNDAILLIQSHERARVGRKIAIGVKRKQDYERKLASGELTLKEIDPKEMINAAITIQKTWRGFFVRREMKRRRAREEEAIGMTMPSWRPRKVFKDFQSDFQERLDMQMLAVQQMEDTIKNQKEKIWEIHGPGLVEDIQDEIRQWFLLWFEELGYFDAIPEAENGGTIMIATGQARTPKEYLAELAEEESKKTSAESSQEPEQKQEEESSLEIEGWKMQESKALPFLVKTNNEFTNTWSFRIEQILDPKGALVIDLIKDNLCYELQREMRKKADELMRAELKELNQALLLDHADDKEKMELPKPQKLKNVEEGKMPKEKKDPLENVTPDELLIELTRSKVIRDCPECHLSEWPGVVSYVLRGDPEVRLGDIKQPVMDYCVLPMASKAVHELAPLVRSVCLCGPPGCGQLFVAHAICTELKATVINLTPEKHVGRFVAKESQDRLVHAVVKLARAYAPSVVLVEGEKAWFKRIPPDLRRVNPKRFAPIYKKILKGIRPGDRVLFLTTSTEPYMAGKPFVKHHDKFIIIPVADYGTMYLAYTKALMSHRYIDRHLNVSCLARLMANQTQIELAQEVLDKSLSITRRMDFKRRPLQSTEIFEQWLEAPERLEQKDLDSFQKFRSKLPLEKKRRQKLEAEERPKDKKKNG